MDQASKSPLGGTRTTARAFFVSERLNASGLERGDVLSTTPLAFRVNQNGGVAILFRAYPASGSNLALGVAAAIALLAALVSMVRLAGNSTAAAH